MSINHLLPNLLFILCISLCWTHSVLLSWLLLSGLLDTCILLSCTFFAFFCDDRIVRSRFTFVKVWVIVTISIVFSLFLYHLFQEVLEIIFIIFFIVWTFPFFLVRVINFLWLLPFFLYHLWGSFGYHLFNRRVIQLYNFSTFRRLSPFFSLWFLYLLILTYDSVKHLFKVFILSLCKSNRIDFFFIRPFLAKFLFHLFWNNYFHIDVLLLLFTGCLLTLSWCRWSLTAQDRLLCIISTSHIKDKESIIIFYWLLFFLFLLLKHHFWYSNQFEFYPSFCINLAFSSVCSGGGHLLIFKELLFGLFTLLFLLCKDLVLFCFQLLFFHLNLLFLFHSSFLLSLCLLDLTEQYVLSFLLQCFHLLTFFFLIL